MSSSALFSECHRLALAVAPELGDRPLYLMTQEEFAGQPSPTACLGWAEAQPVIDYNLVDILGGRWQGPGRVVCLDLPAIAQAAAAPDQVARCTLNVLLHEVGHLVPRTELPTREAELVPTPAFKQLQLECRKLAIAIPEPEAGAADDPHDWRFIRRCCHLFYRACALGWDIPAMYLFGPRQWQSPTEFYLTLLLPECVRMSGATFQEIETEQPPAEFMQLWRQNLSHYPKFLAR
jgi:hypothetical protein